MKQWRESGEPSGAHRLYLFLPRRMFSPFPAKLSRLLRTEKSGQESINLPMLVWILIKILNLSFLRHAYFVSSCLLPQCSLCFIFTEVKWPKSKSIMVYWSRVVEYREYYSSVNFERAAALAQPSRAFVGHLSFRFGKAANATRWGRMFTQKTPRWGLNFRLQIPYSGTTNCIFSK